MSTFMLRLVRLTTATAAVVVVLVTLATTTPTVAGAAAAAAGFVGSGHYSGASSSSSSSRLYSTPPSTPSSSTTASTTTSDSFKKADFIAAVAEKTELTKVDSDKFMQAVWQTLQEQVSAGKRVTVPGFGTFTLRARAARKGRNPATGQEMDIPATKSVGFSAAKAWKDALNGK